VDVERHLRGAKLIRVGALGRLLPALRRGEEHLHAVSPERRGVREGLLVPDVRPDHLLRVRHAARI
jgi:hypothetical protein